VGLTCSRVTEPDKTKHRRPQVHQYGHQSTFFPRRKTTFKRTKALSGKSVRGSREVPGANAVATA
jgi:hypothetical protein